MPTTRWSIRVGKRNFSYRCDETGFRRGDISLCCRDHLVLVGFERRQEVLPFDARPMKPGAVRD